jgi:subtilisin family serine protease
MSEPVPRKAILAAQSVTQPVDVDHLNAILEDAGLGRPLGLPVRRTPAVAVLPVSAADPQEVAAVLRRAEGDHFDPRSAGYSVDTLDPDGKTKQSPPPTVELDATEELHANGAKSGHGTVTWIPIEKYERPHRPPWPPSGRPPVVVVLDSGVRQHSWLPPQTSHPRFFVVENPDGLQVPDPDPKKLGAYWGHATFLAGLIRLTAPSAQVVSVRLMSDDGTLDDDDVVTALEWLHNMWMDKKHHHVDVVLMAFGRLKKPGESNPVLLQQWINTLSGGGVQFVASAGNDHSHTETIPACLDKVISVGAGTSAADHEPYSNHGPWVKRWRPGTHISIMPLTRLGLGAIEKGNGFAVWSGTSFSAAIYAGELAQDRAAPQAPSAGS